jgi:sulfur-oxidizing protein SoxX
MRNPVVNATFHWAACSASAAHKSAFLLTIAALAGCAQVRVPNDRIEERVASVDGDAVRGREVFVSREAGHCVLCHAAPDVSLSGNIGPPLQGVGSRLSVAQLRLRVVDITRLNPDAVMPAFYRTTGLNLVAARYRDQPVLSARQVEDVVAFLETLK